MQMGIGIGIGVGATNAAPAIPSGSIATVEGPGNSFDPIVVTTTAPHGRSTGNTVLIAGTGTAADSSWTIAVTGATTFTLDGSEPVAASGSGGTWTLVP